MRRQYSPQYVAENWRYAIAKEFAAPNGEAFKYAADGKRKWDDEIHKLSFDSYAVDFAVSHDYRLFAVAVGSDIEIFETESWDKLCVFGGLISMMGAVAFHPKNSNILIASGYNNSLDPYVDPRATILVCAIEKARQQGPSRLESTALDIVSKATLTSMTAALQDYNMEFDAGQLKHIEAHLKSLITLEVSKKATSEMPRIHGRLPTDFDSSIFSPSGKWLLYERGDMPESDNDDDWSICIASSDSLEVNNTLVGHRDGIMWMGFNEDESLIGSAAWDNIRIWDTETGRQVHQFETGHNNWTGAFSPNSQYFAATDAQGSIHIYNIATAQGTEHWVYKSPDRFSGWRRSISWHPDGKRLAAGSGGHGQVLLLDVERKEVIQERLLSMAASNITEHMRESLSSYVSVPIVKFVDNGRKLVYWTTGDASIEMYDLEQHTKWRFARGGTEDGPGAEKWRDENGKLTSQAGYNMAVWEDASKGMLMLAGQNTDLRIWSVKLDN